MTLFATPAEKGEALANCIALGQPLTLVPDRADYCDALLLSQRTILARLERTAA